MDPLCRPGRRGDGRGWTGDGGTLQLRTRYPIDERARPIGRGTIEPASPPCPQMDLHVHHGLGLGGDLLARSQIRHKVRSRCIQSLLVGVRGNSRPPGGEIVAFCAEAVNPIFPR